MSYQAHIDRSCLLYIDNLLPYIPQKANQWLHIFFFPSTCQGFWTPPGCSGEDEGLLASLRALLWLFRLCCTCTGTPVNLVFTPHSVGGRGSGLAPRSEPSFKTSVVIHTKVQTVKISLGRQLCRLAITVNTHAMTYQNSHRGDG